MIKELENKCVKWYQDTYCCNEENVIYTDTLEFKENIHQSVINSPYGKLYVFHSSPSYNGGKSTKFIRLKG